MKKFYSLVSTEKQDQGIAILLDGKPIKTPAKSDMLAPTQGLANLVMQEWADQEETVNPDSMPLTQFISTKIDRVREQRSEISEAMLKYLDTDMLCYRTDEPQDLASAQAQAWDPIIEAMQDFFKIELQTTTGLRAISHGKAANAALKAYVEKLDEDRFTIMQIVTSLSGSILTSIMFIEGDLAVEEVLAAARVEERYKDTLYDAEKYGTDPMFKKKDKAALMDLQAAQAYLKAL